MTLPYKTRIEYIESTDANPCRFTIENFNLNMALNSGNTIVVETENKYSEVFSSAKYEYIANFSGLFYSMTSGTGYFGLGGSTVFDNYIAINPTKYQKLRLEFTATTRSELYVDDVLAAHRTAGLSYGTVSKFYFMWGRGDNQFNFAHKKKYIKIWYNGVLTYYYVPVLDNNDVPCWFDKVTQTLLYADTGYTPTVYGDPIENEITEVDYIITDGTQYISTGINTAEDIEIEGEFSLNSVTSTYQNFCAARVSAASNAISQGFGSTFSKLYFGFGNNSEYESSERITPTADVWYHLKQNKNNFIINGTSYNYNTGYTTTFDTPLELIFLGRNNNGTKTATLNAKVRWLTIKKNGTLVKHYVPVLDNEGSPCFLEKVSGEIIYSDSGYAFTQYGHIGLYANQVEYIGSNNNARFTITNLGLTTSKNLLIESDIKWINYPNSINGEYRLDLVGGWQGVNSSGKWILASGVAGGDVSTTEFQNVKFYLDNTHSKTSIIINGEESVYRTTNPLTIDYLNVFYGTYGSTTYYANNLKKYLKIYIDNKLVRDYIPVVDHDGIPAFYDKISNTMLYAEAGYTPTIYGNPLTYQSGNYQRRRQLITAKNGLLPYYCELEYIASTPEHPARFTVTNLPYTGTAGQVFEYETITKYISQAAISEEGESNRAGYYWQVEANGTTLRLGASYPTSYQMSTTSYQILKLERVAGTKVDAYINGTLVGTRTANITAVGCTNFILFGGQGNNTYYTYQYKKSAKFWLNGVLIHDYIPVLDYNRVPCWYDKVTQTLLYADTGYTPTVYGREIHPIPRIHKERLLNYDLGAVPLDVTDSIEMKFLRDDTTVTNILFRQAETESDIITKLTTTSIINRYFASAWFYDGSAGSGNTFSGMDYDIPTELIIKSGTIIVDGVSGVLTNTGTSLPNGNFYLFGLPSNSSKFFGYFYYFRIRSAGGTLKMNVVPIVDETGAPYLWESVSRTILTPSGSGTLSYDDILLDCVANTLYTGSNIGGAYTTIPYKANQNTCIKAIFKIDDMQISRYIMGANGYFISHGITSGSDRIRFNYNYASVDLFNLPSYTNIVNVSKIKEKNIVNGIEIDNNEGEFTVADDFNIFTSSTLNNSLVGRVYALEISEQNSILYNLVPAIKNGQIGLLNTLTDTIYPSERQGVPFVPHFLPQKKQFNAFENVSYWEWEIDTTLLDANNKTFGFYQNTPNFDIDWGDGTYEAGATSHTYAEAGKYTIRIYKTGTLGRFYWYDSSNPNQYSVCLTAVNTPMPLINQPDLSQCFRSCTNLSKVCDDFFVNNRHATYVNYFFYECPLSYIPKNILKGMYVLGSVTGLFAKTNVSEVPVDLFADVKTNCTITACFSVTKIKTLPAHLIDRLVDCTNASQFVNQCTELEYLPDLFFQYQTKVTNWRYLAYGAPKLKLNANLFCDESTDIATHFSSVVPDFTGAFSKTAYTGTTAGTAPQLWNYTYGGTPTTTGCFSGAGNSTTSLTNYSSIPQAWGGPA